jgi:two-component system NtrC family sensor kinase
VQQAGGKHVRFKGGIRTLRGTLAFYFLPITILPTLFLSYYSLGLFQDGTRELSLRRAQSERDAIVAELENLEAELLKRAREIAADERVVAATRRSFDRGDALAGVRTRAAVRLYGTDGPLIAAKRGDGVPDRVAYLPKEQIKLLRAKGESVERFFLPKGAGFATLARSVVRDFGRVSGVIELEARFGPKELAEIKNRRQIDVVLLDRALTNVAASFALSPEALQGFTLLALRQGAGRPLEPIPVQLGDARYAAFLFDLPSADQRNKAWAFIAVFLSMDASEALAAKLRVAMIFLTCALVLVASLLIFVFSNRVVKPIERLVIAMKRVKAGGVEEIPPIESAYEIEYLVHAFNEMARNVSAAKRALELKLEEVRDANQGLKEAQSQLVQSAKMVSLGQIVAGVAHELNNPIAFIYSNMHHLEEYVEKLNRVIAEYREAVAKLPEAERAKLRSLEGEVELDYILKDMRDIVASCADGATRTKDIVLGLRTFSRADESGFRPTDLHEGLRSTLKLLGSNLRESVEVHEEFADIPMVEANASQINQVFMNLLTNAMQAIVGSHSTPSGLGALGSARKGNVWIRSRTDGPFVEIEIEDDGPGIPKEHLEKIFDPFFTTKRVGQGTGLGLSIVYGIVQRHHGTIHVHSKLGQGTRFVVRLPIVQPTSTALRGA